MILPAAGICAMATGDDACTVTCEVKSDNVTEQVELNTNMVSPGQAIAGGSVDTVLEAPLSL